MVNAIRILLPTEFYPTWFRRIVKTCQLISAKSFVLMAIMMILEEVDMSTLVSRIQKNAGVEMQNPHKTTNKNSQNAWGCVQGTTLKSVEIDTWLMFTETKVRYQNWHDMSSTFQFLWIASQAVARATGCRCGLDNADKLTSGASIPRIFGGTTVDKVHTIP